MSEHAVVVDGLEKVFDVPERDPGLVAATKGLLKRKTREVRAVDAISFTVDQGEVVGFLGPNGAGKTTTLKMLSGLLHPSGGDAHVLGALTSTYTCPSRYRKWVPFSARARPRAPRSLSGSKTSKR